MEARFDLGKKLLFVVMFALLALIGLNVNFSQAIGAANQYFTFFQFFGPIAGGFLGPLVGALTVLVAQVANFALTSKVPGLLDVLRLFPMMFAAFYFATNRSKLSSLKGLGSILVPLLCILAFVLNPVGGQVWFFALFWTIPLLVKLLPENLFLRSLGSTFTAHAVGGAIWAWTVPMTPAAWIALIPVVIYERTLFSAGIAVSYVAFSSVLNRLASFSPSWFAGLHIDKRYAL